MYIEQKGKKSVKHDVSTWLICTAESHLGLRNDCYFSMYSRFPRLRLHGLLQYSWTHVLRFYLLFSSLIKFSRYSWTPVFTFCFLLIVIVLFRPCVRPSLVALYISEHLHLHPASTPLSWHLPSNDLLSVSCRKKRNKKDVIIHDISEKHIVILRYLSHDTNIISSYHPALLWAIINFIGPA